MKLYGLSCFWIHLLYEVIIERWIESMSPNQHLVVLRARSGILGAPFDRLRPTQFRAYRETHESC
jgi:hypothetical protein